MAEEGEQPLGMAELVGELDSRMDGGSDEKVIAMKAIRTAIDPMDDAYDAQKALASEGLVELLITLLDDKDAEVVTESAITLAALTANSENVTVRLRHGKEVGYGERPDQVNFNPVQATVEECQGISKLVGLLDSDTVGIQEAAQEALASACSFNHDNKLSQLRVLVHDLLEGKENALEKIDRLLAGMEVRDDVAVVLDQAILPVLKLLEGAQSDSKKLDAVIVLGTICEERPAAGSFLSTEGGLKPVAQLILSGDGRLRDAGIHTMWHMIKKSKASLQPGRKLLGVEGSALVQPLVDVIQAAGVESDTDEKGFDNSDEALLLLKALAEQDPSVREAVKGMDLETSKCIFM